jgi:adenosylhomocysteine nucleosidase
MLTERFQEALVYASQLHANQNRKASATPYISHLLGVTALVLEAGGDEDQAIAALLHDAVEDQGGMETLVAIRRRFGERVARIVDGCTDAYQRPKPPWKKRKVEYISHLRQAPEEVCLVSLADKVHNARAILADLRQQGGRTWDKFFGGREGTLWYYRALADVFQASGNDPLTGELARVVAEIERLAAPQGEQKAPTGEEEYKVVVLVSANIEWQAIRKIFPKVIEQVSPMGEWFTTQIEVGGLARPVIYFHGGWGKISAAASCQYVIDRWSPRLLVNLGTCGGFEGSIEKGTIVLVERTIVYDIIEQMGDFDEHIAAYSTEIDLSWLDAAYPHRGYPQPVVRHLLVSADRDLVVDEIPELKRRYGAVAGDWESGAIAWVAKRNQRRCLILRGVTDLVSTHGGEAYQGNIQLFVDNAARVLTTLIRHLPEWTTPIFVE